MTPPPSIDRDNNMSDVAFTRDQSVMQLYEQLLEIEQRLIPTGLHVFGRAAELREKCDLLRMVASFDRPEHGARSLPKVVAEALGIHNYAELLHETPGNETNQLIDEIVAEGVRRFCQEPNGIEDAVSWLKSRAGVDRDQSVAMF